MCIMCEGGSRDDVMFNLHSRVKRFGVALQRVDVEPPGLSWTYSVGLTDREEHPELVVLGGSPQLHSWLLGEVRDLIEDGEWLSPGDELVVDGTPVGVGEVHPHHIQNGLVATWVEYYYADLRRFDLELEVLQLVLPDGLGCHRHQRSVPLLSDPLASWEAGIAVGPDRVDRAERRRRERADAKRRAIEQRHLN